MILNMIVKDEAHIIKRCLDSAYHFGARDYVILDTGSTDKTMEAIQLWASDLLGVSMHLYQDFLPQPLDFGAAREQALNLVSHHYLPDWVLFLDADDPIVTGPDHRREWQELIRREDPDAVNLLREGGGQVWPMIHLVHTRNCWHWQGRRDEMPVCENPNIKILSWLDGPRINIISDGARGKNRKAAMEEDISILREELEKPISPFERRQILMNLYTREKQSGKTLEAIKHAEELQALVEKLVDEHLTHKVLMDRARMAIEMGNQPSMVIDLFLQAHERDTDRRGETFGELGKYLNDLRRFHAAYEMLSIAVESEKPKNPLYFIDESWYSWRALDHLSVSAYWTGRYEESRNLIMRILSEGMAPETEWPRIIRNLEFTEKKLWPLDFPAAE